MISQYTAPPQNSESQICLFPWGNYLKGKQMRLNGSCAVAVSLLTMFRNCMLVIRNQLSPNSAAAEDSAQLSSSTAPDGVGRGVRDDKNCT
jgi:hypothetical protein